MTVPRRRTPKPTEAQRAKALAAAASAAGRAEGLRDALLLVGLGIGLGLAGALSPQPGKCPKRSLTLGQCRHDAGHEGDCDPRPWR